MGRVVDIDAYEPHAVGELICLDCLFRWVAVIPTALPLKNIVCPTCRETGTIIATGQNIEDEQGEDTGEKEARIVPFRTKGGNEGT